MSKTIKHQILPIREAEWKFEYLKRKIYNEDINITKFSDRDLVNELIKDFLKHKNEPEALDFWIENNLSEDLKKKLNQAIRKRRQRYTESANLVTRKKIVELEFTAWKELSDLSKKLDLSLSETILQMKQLINSEELQKLIRDKSIEKGEEVDPSILIDFDT